MPSPILPLQHLQVARFRNYATQALAFQSPVTLVTGPNGAGKTSLLEAVHVLLTGRSFRTGRQDKLVQNAADDCLLVAEVHGADDRQHRIGMSRGRRGLDQLKLDGEACRSQAPVAQLLPVVALHPATVDLVEGGASERRRLLDWLMFHVEHEFLTAWRGLNHAVRQRNALLKKRSFRMEEIRVWDHQLSSFSAKIDQLRQRVFEHFDEAFRAVLERLDADMPSVTLALFSGWDTAQPLEAVLADRLGQDQQRGFTSSGAHRADLRLSSPEGAVKEVFSRGQKKLVAYALVLAAIEVLAARPVRVLVLVDDLASELDQRHCRQVLSLLCDSQHQVLITALAGETLPGGLIAEDRLTMFHVEHGELNPAHGPG